LEFLRTVGPKRDSAAVGLLIVGLAAAGHLVVRGSPPLGDEGIHLQQIQALLDRDFRNFVPMLAGYHAVLAGLAQILGFESIDAFRLISLCAGLLSVVAFFLCARRLGEEDAPPRTLGYFFLPILFPLFYLVFTDPLALFFVLLSVLLYLDGRFRTSGLIASIAILFRQTSVTWLVMLFLMIYFDQNRGRVSWERIRDHLARTWTFLLGLIGFVIFVVVNRGLVVASSPAAYSDLSGDVPIHSANLFFSMILIVILLLPTHLANASRVRALLRKRPWIILTLLALPAIYFLTFDANHPWNVDEPWYLRNRILDLMRSGGLTQAAALVIVAFGILSIAVTKLSGPGFYWLYPFWILSLLPIQLVEPRYHLVPIVLVLLFRKPNTRRTEWATIAYSAALSIYLFWGVVTEAFFM
jgi:alpha-1,2-glucosyltransferase